MKSLIPCAAFVLLAASACNTNPASRTTEEASPQQQSTETENEWISLFDGESLDGWHTYGKETAGSAWKAEDGVLYLDASRKEDWQTEGGGDILTEQEFEDFHLQLEWKISKNGNSGIMFYVKEDPERYEYPWHTGPEMQILDTEGHPDGKIYKHRVGDLYDLIAAEENAAKPVGEWNEVEVISKDAQLDFYLNDVHIVSTSLWDENWQQLIEESKFKDMPDFGAMKRGKIALQDHGDPVWFRNIRIKRL
jgi:hypothetical protein